MGKTQLCDDAIQVYIYKDPRSLNGGLSTYYSAPCGSIMPPFPFLISGENHYPRSVTWMLPVNCFHTNPVRPNLASRRLWGTCIPFHASMIVVSLSRLYKPLSRMTISCGNYVFLSVLSVLYNSTIPYTYVCGICVSLLDMPFSGHQCQTALCCVHI